MSSYKDITGQKFGRLTAVRIHLEPGARTKWLCRCECGKEKVIPLGSLTSGRGKSCGCLRRENTSKTFRKHGLMDEPLYSTWISMRSRCRNKKNPSYKRYGSRGIDVCPEWDDFRSFYKWAMTNGYKAGLSIDRIDNDGNYEPNNCRWADKETQANNTSKNVFLEIEGITRTISEHAKHYGMDYSHLYYRYESGFREEQLIAPSMKQPIMINIDGVEKNLKEWSRVYGLSYNTVQHRYKKGLRGKNLFLPPGQKFSEMAKKRKRG